MNGNHLTPQGMFINSPFESTLHDSKRAPVSEITRGFSNVNPLPQYSDAHPYGMNLRTHSEREINREKIFISCLQKKNSADTAYDFKIDFPREIKNIKRIKVISIAVDYTPDSTAYRNGFLYFDNMESSTTIDQKNYHIYFPITQGVSGTPVKFNYVPTDMYLQDLKQLTELNRNCNIKTLVENPSTGVIADFTLATYIGVELELHVVSPARI